MINPPSVPMGNKEEAKILAIFETELPDPESILFVQNLPEFEIFTYFPKLPIEIRLMIVRAALEPRRVKLGIDMVTPPPMVFRLNRESREEGLKHYNTILNTWLEHKIHDKSDQETAVVYFAPKIDTLVILDVTVFTIASCLIGYEEELGTSFAGIRSLELSKCVLAYMRPLPDSDITKVKLSEDFDRLQRSILFLMNRGYFRRLEELHASMHRHVRMSEERKRRMEKVLIEVFRAAGEDFPDAKIPRISWI